MELEILAITKPPKRLMKTINRVVENLLSKHEKGVVNLELVLGTSRSGDIYNALKFLESKELIERNRDEKLIRIQSISKLEELKDKIKRLLNT